MDDKNDPLFYRKEGLHSLIRQCGEALAKEVRSLSQDYILNVSENDLCESLIGKYHLQTPHLRLDERFILNYEPTDVDISQDRGRYISDRSIPLYIEGTVITVAVPFDGDGRLFEYQPSTHSLTPPRGKVVGQELHLDYEITRHNEEQLKNEINNELGFIKKYLELVSKDLEEYNNSLPQYVRNVVSQRKSKLLADAGLVSSLGIPIKRREGIPQTYAPPEIRRKAVIRLPKVSTEDFKPEPALAHSEYDHILSIIEKMAYTIELSPQAYAAMNEETLRFQLLVPLNSHYKRATGETFNYSGKTDILIQVEGKNVFIAECKIWQGPKKLLETIDQLLSYLSWRDTKTAIILFNRNKNFSAVLEKIDETVPQHPNFKRPIGKQSKTHSQYVFHQPNDPNREVTLAILAFDVPRETN